MFSRILIYHRLRRIEGRLDGVIELMMNRDTTARQIESLRRQLSFSRRKLQSVVREHQRLIQRRK